MALERSPRRNTRASIAAVGQSPSPAPSTPRIRALPTIDACGSAAFTADAYAATDSPVQLVDRSRAMLERADARIGEAPHVALMQADVFGLPFPPRAVDMVLAMGLVHLLDDVPAAAAALAGQARGRVFVTSLVAATPVAPATCRR